MNTWPRVPLRRAASIINGGTPTPDDHNWGGNVPWATPVDLATVDGGHLQVTERLLTEKGLKTGSRTVPVGSLIISTRAPIGYVAQVNQVTAFNQGCRGLVPRDSCDGRFLQYALISQTDVLQSLGTGSTFLELSTEALANVMVPLPPLEEQRRIANYLDAQTTRIDQAIQLRQQQRGLLRERLESLACRLVLGEPNAGSTNKSGFWPGTQWPLTPLGRFAVKRKRPAPEDSEVVTAFRDGFVGPRSARRDEGYTFSQLEQAYQGVHAGDLVFHGLDGFAGATGVATADGRCSPVYHVISTVRDDPHYMAAALRLAAQLGILEVAMPSTRQRAVDFRNWSTLASVTLPRPPIYCQRSISRKLNDLNEETKSLGQALQREIDLLAERKQSVIAQMVEGS